MPPPQFGRASFELSSLEAVFLLDDHERMTTFTVSVPWAGISRALLASSLLRGGTLDLFLCLLV